jgi:hypothetical protein
MEVFAMDYEYRNIDTDIELYNSAKQYWSEQITKQEMYDNLANKLYSKTEADRAISDYYYIHVYSNIVINIMCIFALSILGIFAIINYILSLINA